MVIVSHAAGVLVVEVDAGGGEAARDTYSAPLKFRGVLWFRVEDAGKI